MRFDLVDLQLFIAVARPAASPQAQRACTGAGLRQRTDQGPEAALGDAAKKRGRRGVKLTSAGESLLDHAASSCTMSKRCAAIAAFASGGRASVHLLANTSGISEYLPRALADFLPSTRAFPSTWKNAERQDRARHCFGDCRPRPCRGACAARASSACLSEDRLRWCRRGRVGQPPPGRFARWWPAISSASSPRARCARHQPGGKTRRAPALPRADEQFRRHRPNGGRQYGVADAGVAARRCASR